MQHPCFFCDDNLKSKYSRIWYDNCDGIYLNYNWDDEMLLSSADFGALNKIFVGIDVFARGCIGSYRFQVFYLWSHGLQFPVSGVKILQT